MKFSQIVPGIILGAICVAFLPHDDHHGSQAASAAPAPAATDSYKLEMFEQRNFMKKIAAEPLLRSVRSCEITSNDGKSLTLTMDADAYTTLSEQDQDLLKKALYLEWVETYSLAHSGTPHYLVLYIRDLTGTKIASYY